MKKSLIAAALLGTFAASAFAAPSVTLYGRIDTSLAYTHLNRHLYRHGLYRHVFDGIRLLHRLPLGSEGF